MVTHFPSAARVLVFTLALAAFLSGGVTAADSSLVKLEDRINDLIYRASRSVVTIEAVQSRREAGPASGREALHTLIASGLVYDSLGHILVAASSVQGRDPILVHSDNRLLPATVIGTDYQSGLALIKTDRAPGIPISIIATKGCAGQMIVALGNAYGIRASPSIGFCAGFRPDGTMQFSAPITSGTVGGGVFDMAGNLVGAITGGIGQDRWVEVGLAVPASSLPGIVEYLKRNGDRVAGYVGISIADIEITPPLEISLPVTLASTGGSGPRVIERGVMITDVVTGSPADRAGLDRGDLLLSLNRVPVNSAAEVKRTVQACSPGRQLDIGFIRNKNVYQVRLEVVRLEHSTVEQPVASDLDGDVRSRSADSLAREIDSLRRALDALEDRLRQLR